jgi:hypothetical protein
VVIGGFGDRLLGLVYIYRLHSFSVGDVRDNTAHHPKMIKFERLCEKNGENPQKAGNSPSLKSDLVSGQTDHASGVDMDAGTYPGPGI